MSGELYLVGVGDGVVDAELHAGVDGELVEGVGVGPGGVDDFVVVRVGLPGGGGGVQAQGELLADFAVGVDHDVAGVGVDTGQSGHGDRHPGFFEDLADRGVDRGFSGFDLAAG